MLKRLFHRICKIVVISILIFSLVVIAPIKAESGENDIPLVFKIVRIRSLSIPGKPFFNVSISVDGKKIENIFRIPIRGYDVYLEWPIAYVKVPYDREEPISIEIKLFYSLLPFGVKRECDISKDGKSLNIVYDVRRGEWRGEDFLGDGNGYGHSSGFEDGNYNENDCEIWFDIYQVRTSGRFFSSDRLTLWELENVYHLDPSLDYSTLDIDNDGIPTSWEDKYGYDPLSWDDHKNMDPDRDGLDNIEEWKTSKWLSDPFAQDIFIEVDYMQTNRLYPRVYTFPEKSQQMLLNAFAKHNITVHIDDGKLGGGGDIIPFDPELTGEELMQIREKYFLRGDPNNWRRGVFHYAIFCCKIKTYGRSACGRMFYTDSFVIAEQCVRHWIPVFYLRGSSYPQAIASVFMHELGHNLGIFHSNTPGCDNENTRFPWQREYWKYGNYKSCMNYRYVYKLVDYSDGTHGENDFDDWDRIDLTLINYA